MKKFEAWYDSEQGNFDNDLNADTNIDYQHIGSMAERVYNDENGLEDIDGSDATGDYPKRVDYLSEIKRKIRVNDGQLGEAYFLKNFYDPLKIDL